jgi:hypothetical protein
MGSFVMEAGSTAQSAATGAKIRSARASLVGGKSQSAFKHKQPTAKVLTALVTKGATLST